MADATGPILLVVGGDTKRLQWLTHHVTSHWPNAQVTTAAGRRIGFLEPADRRAHPGRRHPAGRLRRRSARPSTVLHHMTQMLRIQPALYCILLADNGSELSAVRALKGGAKDYLPLARITRDQLLGGDHGGLRQAPRRRAGGQGA